MPIILLKIRDINDIDIVYELLKAHEFFRAKNIDVDLIILNAEKAIYEQYVKEGIERAILDRHSHYLINDKIFILNSKEIDKEDKNLFMLRANIILDASSGSVKTQIDDLEEEYLEGMKNVE